MPNRLRPRAATNTARRRTATLGLACLGLAATCARAEPPLPQASRLESSPVLRGLLPNPSPTAPTGHTAEQTVGRFHVRPGFRVELIAAEPNIHQPVAFAIDARGRLWVAEAHSYPQKRPAGGGLDRIVILADADGDGRFESHKIFASGLNLVSGIEVGHGGVWVGAAPELLFIPDRNEDDVPDGAPQVLLDGFGYQDTHECLNSFLWGPDGWLYGNQGVFNSSRIGKPGADDAARIELRAGVWRYHPVTHTFEVFAHGGSNQWGLDYDERGQLFMTHCRSYYGRGPTTHVIQGGHYWNQANANHAPFILANPPEDFPELVNYLLSSARYDHGAGGAGKPGSDAIYGGHSHVGTMIYLGDNWPEALRGHLFTHNLGGHQINHQVNRRLGSGFDTVHAGYDLTFCTDPAFVAVDLQYGPDGAVYMLDWTDLQHCHNPNTERWDRGNGRIYRLQYDATFKPWKGDLALLKDVELVRLQSHRNQWHARTARRLLHERATTGTVRADATTLARTALLEDKNPLLRLNALWSLHAAGKLAPDLASRALDDPDEYVRAWTLQLTLERREPPAPVRDRLVPLALNDPSPVVRLYLAAALQRLPDPLAWPVAEALAGHGEDAADRNIPLLVWHGMAPRVPSQPDRAAALAAASRWPQLGEFIAWYRAATSVEGLEAALADLGKHSGADLNRRLALLELAAEIVGTQKVPAAWPTLATTLYASQDTPLRRRAERLGARFGDLSLLPRFHAELAAPPAPASTAARYHAFHILAAARHPSSIPTLIRLLDDPGLRSRTIPLLQRFDDPAIPPALIAHIPTLPPADRAAALAALCARPNSTLALLNAIEAGTLPRSTLTAHHVRLVMGLNHPEITRRIAATWGRVQTSAGDKAALLARLEKAFNEAPLWAYDANAGRQHFQKLCASCHKLRDDGVQLGPELTGAGGHGIRYYLENILEPDAVVGTDFQASTFETKAGESVTGLVAAETGAAITVRTPTGPVTLQKSEIASSQRGQRSLMPEGLLEGLNDREQIELLKYLLTN